MVFFYSIDTVKNGVKTTPQFVYVNTSYEYFIKMKEKDSLHI